MSPKPWANESIALLASEDHDVAAPSSGRSGRRADYDTALAACGFGPFQYWLVLTIGWANASDAVELLCVSALLPAAECDLNMTAPQKGYLSSSAFVGLLLGGYFWGGLGDTLGRKTMLVTALLFNAAFGLLSSTMQTFWPFLICRFFSGLGVGGAVPLVFAYFSEFSPRQYRGRMISCVSYFWIIGTVVVACLAWAVIPREMGYESNTFKFTSWRIFVVLATFPSLASALALTRFPASPKYLMARGMNEEALDILRRVHRFNGGKPDDYPISSLDIVEYADSGRRRSPATMVRDVLEHTRELFRTCLRPTLVMMAIQFSVQFGYYGLWVWFPELFNRLESYHALHPHSSLSVCDVIDAAVASNSTDPCRTATEPATYQDECIVAAAPLVLNVWTLLHMDKLGRKFFLMMGMFLSSASVFLIYVVKETWQNIALSCLFGSVSNLSFSALNCFSAELFPTRLRSTAIAVTIGAARVGAVLGTLAFGQLLYLNCAVPLLLVAALLAGGGVLSCLLPNTSGVALQ